MVDDPKIVNETALVFSSDEKFAPLAKGLVLSIVSQCEQKEFALKLIDIGCEQQTLAWMKGHGVEVIKFDRQRFFGNKLDLHSYQDAQICRPFIPQLFPGYEIYIWCDADIWIQKISSLRLYRDAVLSDQSRISISPLIDVAYAFYYQDASEFIRYSSIWFLETYGATVAETYSNRAIFSSGLFGMHAHNPIWKAWATEISAAFQRSYSDHSIRHLAEQVALNYLIYAGNRYVALEAIHNYNCHIGIAVRGAGDRIVLNTFPYREVGIVHLTACGRKINEYIATGLLFDAGRYLSEEELNRLREISHY